MIKQIYCFGRGKEHFSRIKKILDYAESNKTMITINTVASRLNQNEIFSLGEFLSSYSNLRVWRIFKFMPLREKAKKNRLKFEITDEEFETVKEKAESFKNLTTRFIEEKDMQDVLIVANGDIYKTENGIDVKKGNALLTTKNILDFMNQKPIDSYKLSLERKAPNLVIIGNIAYDTIDFSKVLNRPNITNIGGACIFSSIPASLFYKVGIVSKVGNDFDLSKLYKYNIDLSGVKTVDLPTTKFYTIWNSADGQERTETGEINLKMEVGAEDIPKHFLKAKHFHLTTASPEKQLEIIRFLREHTNATISADTIDRYAWLPNCKEVFDNVDIAFIDKEYKNLLDCKAKTKIIKYGKTGCLYYSEGKSFPVKAQVVENVVDKTGAGDCLNGIFVNLLANGVEEKEALQTAVFMATESVKSEGIMSLELPDEIKNGGVNIWVK